MISEEILFNYFFFIFVLHNGFHGNQYKPGGQKYMADKRLVKEHFKRK